jgi:hypothetical protein
MTYRIFIQIDYPAPFLLLKHLKPNKYIYMIKKLFLGCLFMAVCLSSCEKYDNTSQAKDGEISIKTVSMVTFATMTIALLVAYSYRRR